MLNALFVFWDDHLNSCFSLLSAAEESKRLVFVSFSLRRWMTPCWNVWTSTASPLSSLLLTMGHVYGDNTARRLHGSAHTHAGSKTLTHPVAIFPSICTKDLALGEHTPHSIFCTHTPHFLHSFALCAFAPNTRRQSSGSPWYYVIIHKNGYKTSVSMMEGRINLALL